MAILRIYPLNRILRGICLSPFWAILAFVRLVNLIGLWVVAFVDRPVRRNSPAGL